MVRGLLLFVMGGAAGAAAVSIAWYYQQRRQQRHEAEIEKLLSDTMARGNNALDRAEEILNRGVGLDDSEYN